MKKGEILEGVVAEVQFPNKGIVHAEDKQVIVKNSVPGQKVRFSVSKIRKGKAEGRLLEVIEPAPNEIKEGVCPHFGICGGCNYQNLSYEDQLELKSSQVKKLLCEVLDEGVWEKTYEGIKESPRRFSYRNKMEFTFGDEVKDGPLSVGMHKRGSFYDIVTVDECRIMDDDFKKVLKSTLEYFREKNTAYYHRMRHTGYLRHLLVRKAVKTGDILVDIITTTELPKAEEETLIAGWKDVLLSNEYEGKMKGILHTHNDSLADAVKDEGTSVLFGEPFFFEELLGLKFKISPFSFFQTNSLGAEVLYETAREFIGEIGKENPTVFDLYSGTGTIAQMLSAAAGKVIGVEIVEEAVEAAKDNAALNGIDNCEFIADDVLKALDNITDRPDFIVLDPPRDGIHPKALDKIIRYGVDRLIYISCKPTSLARDLVMLQERGYKVDRIACVDMFPGTVHVETVVLLSREAD
ncbi:MAG: 23S rRNA (uracil(1939)-C(5))-methyltransferase RlmD [Eubacterium sp.]|nr:23S rRNA (uracil(1939)-C(5))-methyltransferase RlmD [Eubacterium sp.]